MGHSLSQPKPARSTRLPIGEASGFRQRARELQWALPLQLQSVLLRVVGGRYNPYSEWNRRHRAIFVHVPRTGGTSISFALGAPKRHVPVSRYAAFDWAAFNDYFKFALVRNPWDRLLSAFSTLRGEPDKTSRWIQGQLWARTHLSTYRDFESFVLTLEHARVRSRIMGYFHFRPQLDWLTLPYSTAMAVDFVGHFERLPEDFAVIARELGSDAELPVTNDSEHTPYRDAYSRRMRDIVDDLYAADIKQLGYTF